MLVFSLAVMAVIGLCVGCGLGRTAMHLVVTRLGFPNRPYMSSDAIYAAGIPIQPLTHADWRSLSTVVGALTAAAGGAGGSLAVSYWCGLSFALLGGLALPAFVAAAWGLMCLWEFFLNSVWPSITGFLDRNWEQHPVAPAMQVASPASGETVSSPVAAVANRLDAQPEQPELLTKIGIVKLAYQPLDSASYTCIWLDVEGRLDAQAERIVIRFPAGHHTLECAQLGLVAEGDRIKVSFTNFTNNGKRGYTDLRSLEIL